ncbi:peptidoglycan-recognition protein SC1a-like [Venturia canescens]|uniref:peptidoglycan-recognition protein SC1a-like n=1 Tax=Venturia canescens TaxID=32260 RepID=UPI001C9D30AA|nr:peptidoglycan-recognition protein SC1a-like [Venturia canescens]
MSKVSFNLCTLASSIVVLFYSFVFKIGASSPLAVRTDCSRNSPNIISRAEWGARQPKLPYETLRYIPAPYVVIHHGGIHHFCYELADCAEVVRSYQNLHMDDRGWIDIGYNFVIGEDGNVYEGRSWDHVGAHAPGYNFHSIGISVIGDFTHFIPNTPALEALDSLISYGVKLGKISKYYKIIGHKQARETMCPGEKFYDWVKGMPGWTDHPIPLYQNSTLPKCSDSDSRRLTDD